MVTPEEIAWASGVFEGEGCFTITHGRLERAKELLALC
jgi:hypothetical protein